MPSIQERILVVEDDARLGDYIARFLSAEGYDVTHLSDGMQAQAWIQVHHPDLVVLDLTLPGKDGLSICRDLRGQYGGMILMFTARDGTVNEVLGLEMGADDYLVKPVEPARLLARVRALFRRKATANAVRAGGWSFGGLQIDEPAQSVTLNGQIVILTSGEYELLRLLAANAGKILSRDDILQVTRGIEYDGLDRSVDVKISQLRKKLGDAGPIPRRIKTIRSRGYIFVASAWA